MTAPPGPDDWTEAETEPFENADDGGRIYEGFIIDRGKDGVEARDAGGGFLGLFPNQQAALGVIPSSWRARSQPPAASPSDKDIADEEPSSEPGPTQEGDVAPEISRKEAGNGGDPCATVSKKSDLEPGRS
jgi:hypothetical protein